jgi:hypothetical protein
MALENRKRPAMVGAVALIGLTVTLGLIVGPGSVLAHAEDGHPVRIHQGTCQSLGPVAFSLAGVNASVELDGNIIATPQTINADKAYQVMVSESRITTTIEDLLASDLAVMLYDNDEDMQAIACGNVGGARLGDTLAVGLGEIGIPGHVGFAVFQPHGDQTDVTILIGHAMSPVSAGGAMPALADTGGEPDHQHESEEVHDDVATPEA